MTFTDAGYRYMTAHPLGRLATIGPDGAPQIHPVAFWVNAETATIDYPHRIIAWNIGEFGPATPGRPPHLQGYSSRNVSQ